MPLMWRGTQAPCSAHCCVVCSNAQQLTPLTPAPFPSTLMTASVMSTAVSVLRAAPLVQSLPPGIATPGVGAGV